MRNIFLEKSCTKCGGYKLVPDPFLKNQIWAYLWINSLKLYTVWFYCMSKLRTNRIYWNWGADHLLLPHIKFFWKTKRGLETILPASFSAEILKKNIPIVTFRYLTNFHCLVAFTSWGIGQYMFRNCLLTRLWRHKFRN